jgi:lipopolysaccharide biosynthesis glycosyltransferase
MDKMLRIFVGVDLKVEPVAYLAFCQSVMEKSTIPVSFAPLALNLLPDYKETHVDGSNAFIYSRFLVPYLCDYKGYALFCDSDMIVRDDVAKLVNLINDPSKAVWVVKHDYKTKSPIKYLGAKNEDYPRKNWSSVMLFNCGAWRNKDLTPEYIMKATGKQLHRFEWLKDELIGELPIEWNWLADEYEYNPDAKLVHFTLGTSCFKDYQNKDYANEWFKVYNRAIYPLTGNGKESEL